MREDELRLGIWSCYMPQHSDKECKFDSGLCEDCEYSVNKAMELIEAHCLKRVHKVSKENTMETNELKAALEAAIADSTASDYDKGNILYLAEQLALLGNKGEKE